MFVVVFDVLLDCVLVNVELKECGFVDDFVVVVGGVEYEIFVLLFDVEVFCEVCEVIVFLVVFFFVVDWVELLLVVVDFDCVVVYLYYDLFLLVWVEEVYDCGFEVNVWMVFDCEIVWWFWECGVDGVVVDDLVFVE